MSLPILSRRDIVTDATVQEGTSYTYAVKAFDSATSTT